MRGKLFLVLSLLLAGSALAQLQNGGFEFWTNNNPDIWSSTDDIITVGAVEPSESAQEGRYAALLSTSVLIEAVFIQQTVINQKTIENPSISFYYAGMSEGLEGGMVAIGFSGDNATGGAGDLFQPNGNGYTRVDFVWEAISNEFDSVSVMFMIYSEIEDDPVIGSVLIDNVELNGFLPLSTRQNDFGPVYPDKIELAAFPNPFNSSTTIDFKAPLGLVSISITDLQGRVVAGWNNILSNGSGSINWDLSNSPSISAGQYMIVIRTGNKSGQFPIILLK